MSRFMTDKKYAWGLIVLIPFLFSFLLQAIIYNEGSLEEAFLHSWYPYGMLICMLIVYVPSYFLLLKLPVFADKRWRNLAIFTASLIVILPLNGYIGQFLACSVFGRCL